MRWRSGILHLLLVTTLSVSLVAAVGPSAASASSLTEAQQKLQEEEAQLKADKAKLAAISSQYYHTLAQLNVDRDNLRVTQDQIAVLNQRISNTKAEENQTQVKLTATQQHLAADHATLASALQGFQTTGTGGLLAVLFSAQNFQDFVSRMDLVAELFDADLGVVHQVSNQEKALAALKSQLLAQEAQLNALDSQKTAQAASLQHETAALQSEAAQLIAEKSSAQASVGQDQADAQATQDLIASLESAGTGQSIGDIHFIWPVHGPITSPFGMRLDPITHEYALHAGIDIGVPTGTPIQAAAAGTVILAGWVTGYGYTVVLDHGDGITTLYAHQSRILVQDGEAVAQGEVIGLAGMTGWATGPHVHFEIRIAAKPVNPIGYLPPGGNQG